MVHHIVMWKFKSEIEEGKKPEIMRAMKEELEALVGKVPGLLTAEFVEKPISSSTHEIALVTTLEKAEDIAAYAVHPEHVRVADTYVRLSILGFQEPPVQCLRATLPEKESHFHYGRATL